MWLVILGGVNDANKYRARVTCGDGGHEFRLRIREDAYTRGTDETSHFQWSAGPRPLDEARARRAGASPPSGPRSAKPACEAGPSRERCLPGRPPAGAGPACAVPMPGQPLPGLHPA